MELRQLRALVTVAEVGTVTRAARLLHLVQPAVTRQIRSLEQELGVQLFVRRSEGMELTPSGEIMVESARRALLELERGTAQIGPRPDQVTGIVAVGVLESLAQLIVPALTTTIREQHPGIQLRVLTGFSGYLQQWLDTGDLDLALLYNLADTPSLATRPLLDERLWAVAPAGAELRVGEPISWELLLSQPLVLPISGHGLRVMIDQARADLDITPDISIETNSMLLQKQLVLAGYGWTVLPAAGVASDAASGLLSAAPLDTPVTTRSVVVGMSRTSRPTDPARAVTELLVEVTRDLVSSGTWPSANLAAGVAT